MSIQTTRRKPRFSWGSLIWALLWMAPLTVFAQDDTAADGTELLDQAMEKKLTAQRMSDLEEVISLCEKSLEAGLDEENQAFAKQLLSSSHYERAQQIMQTLVEPRVNVGVWARRRKIALQALDKAIEVQSAHAESYLLKARLHAMPGGDEDEARAAVNKAIELFSDNPDRRSAALLVRAGLAEDVKQRLADFDQAIDDNPHNLQAWRERGRAYLLNDQPEEAVADFLHLVEKDEDDMESLAVVAQLLAAQDKHERALELIDKVIESNPLQSNAYRLRAGVYLMQENLEQARQDLNKALEIDPRDLSALLQRAGLYEEEGNYEEAKADADRVLELRPGLPQAFLLRSSIAMGSGDYGQAISDLRQLLRRDPNNPSWLLQIGNVYLADNRPNMAVDTFDQVLKEHPEEWSAVRGRADALLGLGKHKEALESYEKALQASPEDNGILNNLAWVLATSPVDSLRDGERAIKLATKACELTEYQAAHILSTLAAGYAEIGDFDKALEWSTKAVELGEGDVKEQLAAELKSYEEKKPWRELQQPDSVQDDLNDLGLLDDEPDEAADESTTEENDEEDSSEDLSENGVPSSQSPIPESTPLPSP